jgi:hypothetical protein
VTIAVDAFHFPSDNSLFLWIDGARNPPRIKIVQEAGSTERVYKANTGRHTPGLWVAALPCGEEDHLRMELEIDGVPYQATARWPAPAQDMPGALAPKRKSRARKRS